MIRLSSRVPRRNRMRAFLALACAGLIGACSSAPTGASAPVATSAAPSVAASPSPTLRPDQVTGSLTVLEWSGYDDAKFWPDFKEKYTKVTLNWEFGQSDADIYGKMKAGSQADLFHPYTGWLQFYVDEGMAEEIDTSRLSNWDKVPDDFKAIGQINGKQYFVPWDWGFTSILYRTDKVKQPIDSWAALLDPQYKGRISMWDDGPGAVTVSSYIHGWDETQITDEQLAQIQKEWTDQKKLNKFYWGAEPDLITGMKGANPQVWVAYAWQGAYATLLAEGVPVAYANPKEGRNSWVGVYGIRKGTQNLEAAYGFLDEKLAAKTGKNVVDNYYYGHANKDVMAGITDKTLKEAFSVDDPAILQKTNFTPNLTEQQRDAWTAMWTEVKAGD
jgi:spermidine/putrescine transport system substrate-binding protein